MTDIPQWLITAIISVIVAGLGFLSGLLGVIAGRRLRTASAGEKEASATKILSEVAADLARQVKAFADEVPQWMQKIAAVTERAEKAEKHIGSSKAIQEQAKIIVDAMDHMEYINDNPEAPETKFAKYFKAAKDAANRIAELKL